MKLADFGISRILPADRSQFTLTNNRGSNCWQAPEMGGPSFESNIASCKYQVDIFPLGLIFVYTLLDGKYAFGSNAEQCN